MKYFLVKYIYKIDILHNILYKSIYNVMNGLQKMYIISCYRRIKFQHKNNLCENKDMKIRRNK